MNSDSLTLNTMLETDEHNIGVSKELFERYGLASQFDTALSLFDQVLAGLYKGFPPNNVPLWEDNGKPKHFLVLRIIMLLSSNTQFHVAIAHLMRGQASEVWGHARRAIEAVGVAHLSLSEPEIAELYMEGDIKAFKAKTLTKKILPPDQTVTSDLNADFEWASQRTHQNLVSTASRIGNTMQILGRRFTFALHHNLYDPDLATVLGNALWLLRCIERTARLYSMIFEVRNSSVLSKIDAFRDEVAEKYSELGSKLVP